MCGHVLPILLHVGHADSNPALLDAEEGGEMSYYVCTCVCVCVCVCVWEGGGGGGGGMGVTEGQGSVASVNH